MTSKNNQHNKQTKEREPLLALFLSHLDTQATISRQEAESLHRTLGKLGFKRNDHYKLAEKLTSRPIKSLTTLTKEEAECLLNKAKETSEQNQKQKDLFKAKEVSDEEALVILG